MDDNNVETDKPVYGIDLMTEEELTKEILHWDDKIIDLKEELRLSKVWRDRCWEKYKERFR